MGDHALLSASGAKRWISCPPSVRVEQDYPESKSGYAAEGSFAHSVAELMLKWELGLIKADTHDSILFDVMHNPYYSQELWDYVKGYCDTVMERVNTAKASDPSSTVLLEQKLDYSPWVKEGFGTGDVVIISDGILEIIDLKYGKGVPVSAEANPQMKLYALGAYNDYGMLYDFDAVQMTIIQPRLDSISTDSISIPNLLKWAEDVVKPTAELAYEGKGEFCVGDHCQFCRAKVKCRKRAEYNLELAHKEFRNPEILSDLEIADILGRIDQLVSWAGQVKEYALDAAVNRGVHFAGWKLVEGRSNRVYGNKEKVAETLLAAGYTEDKIYEKSLLGITAMEKEIGKKVFNETLDGLILKPPGKPALVPTSDKRQEINSLQSAIDDFAE